MSFWRLSRNWAWQHTDTYSLKKAVPSIVIALLQAAFSEGTAARRTLLAIGIIVGTYLVLLCCEFMWKLLIQAPAALHQECTEEKRRLEALQITSQARREVSQRLGELQRGGEAAFQADKQEVAEMWTTEAHGFIKDTFGAGEAELFLSDAGFIFYGGNRIRNWVDGRLRRLGSLIERADALLRQS